MKERILMCPPEYFSDICYSINPWMTVGTECNKEKSYEAWNMLKEAIETKLNADVAVMEPQPKLPDLVFTANAAVVYQNKAVIARFRFDERKPEEQFYADWFQKNGYEVIILPETMNFEGAGDALFSGDTLIAGYMPRTDIQSHTYIAELFNIKVLSLELVSNKFYHIDTCLCPLEGGYLLYFPGAFDGYANKVIENYFPKEKRVAVTEEEANKFSCNAVTIGQKIIMNRTTDRLKSALKEKGFEVIELDLSEFLKSGGSTKCLTLKVGYPSNNN